MNKNRTPDWARVSRSGFLSVTDEPGEINVSALPPLLMPIRLAFGLAALGVAALSLLLTLDDSGWLMIAGGAAFIAASALWPYCWYYLGWAYRVRFIPEGVEFFNLFGIRIGGLEREAMMQIAVEPTAYVKKKSETKNVQLHVFYGDNGFMPALPQKNERVALLRNAVLIAAFQQPLHLDRKPRLRAA